LVSFVVGLGLLIDQRAAIFIPVVIVIRIVVFFLLVVDIVPCGEVTRGRFRVVPSRTSK
jgi:hypothetical protein